MKVSFKSVMQIAKRILAILSRKKIWCKNVGAYQIVGETTGPNLRSKPKNIVEISKVAATCPMIRKVEHQENGSDSWLPEVKDKEKGGRHDGSKCDFKRQLKDVPWWWKCSLFRLYQCQFPSCDTIVVVFKMLSLGKPSIYDVSVSFLMMNINLKLSQNNFKKSCCLTWIKWYDGG